MFKLNEVILREGAVKCWSWRGGQCSIDIKIDVLYI